MIIKIHHFVPPPPLSNSNSLSARIYMSRNSEQARTCQIRKHALLKSTPKYTSLNLINLLKFVVINLDWYTTITTPPIVTVKWMVESKQIALFLDGYINLILTTDHINQWPYIVMVRCGAVRWQYRFRNSIIMFASFFFFFIFFLPSNNCCHWSHLHFDFNDKSI